MERQLLHHHVRRDFGAFGAHVLRILDCFGNLNIPQQPGADTVCRPLAVAGAPSGSGCVGIDEIRFNEAPLSLGHLCLRFYSYSVGHRL